MKLTPTQEAVLLYKAKKGNVHGLRSMHVRNAENKLAEMRLLNGKDINRGLTEAGNKAVSEITAFTGSS